MADLYVVEYLNYTFSLFTFFKSPGSRNPRAVVLTSSNKNKIRFTHILKRKSLIGVPNWFLKNGPKIGRYN